MSLPRFSVNRPVTTCMMWTAVVLLGLIAWSRLPQELYPPITYPQLTVVTRYRDAAPEEIEILVTKPIEETVGTVAGLRRVSSISKEELSIVLAEFNWGNNMDFAALGVREKIDLIKERLPRGSEDPIVMKFNPFDLPVIVLNFSGDMPSYELLQIARKQIKNELEKVDGVAAVNISGGLEREILVEVDQGRLQASGVPIAQVVDALAKANLNYPGGTIKEAFYEYLIRTMGEFLVVPEISQIAVGMEEEKERPGRRQEPAPEDRKETLKRDKGIPPQPRMIMLRDIATVKDTFREVTSVSRYNGRDNIALSIQKQAGANTVQVADKIKEGLKKVTPTLPPGVTLNIAYDQSTLIKQSIAGVADAGKQGAVLSFLVLLLFLGNFWDAFNVCLAIPIAILGTLSLMYFTGTTINTLSLGGLAFGIGLLIDCGINVVENIDTFSRQGKSTKQAAIEGTEHLMAEIFGSEMSNNVVFFPLIFVVGLVGQFMKDFALTVILSNIMGLFAALSLTALLGSLVKHRSGKSPMDPIVDRLRRADGALVRWFLDRAALGILFVAGMFGLALVLLAAQPKEVMPRVDQGQFMMRATLPPGTTLMVTDKVVKRIEQVLQALPEVQDIAVTIGSSKEKKAEELIDTMGTHQSQILINLRPRWEGFGRPPPGAKFRTRNTVEVVQEIKETLGREPLEGAQVDYLLDESVFKSTFAGSAPIVIEVKGTDLKKLEQLTGEVKKTLEEVPGLFGVKTSIIPPSPETKIHVMKDRAATYHLSVTEIATTAQTAVKGNIASKFKEEGREYDIRVRLREQDRGDLNKVRRLIVHSPLDIDVPLAEVAYFSIGKGPTEIRHLDQQRTLLVSAQIFNRPLSEAIEDVTARLKKLKIAPGYSAELTGENAQMAESFRSVGFAVCLSLILVYMVMASEFESLWQPFLIMGSIPMAVIGVAIILFLTQTPVSVMAGIGFLVLGGTVVDSGIAMVERMNTLREEEGMAIKEALIEASMQRLRPVVMAASTTILGVLPLALGLGQGIELQRPMAITTIGGMFASTFLSLVFLPSLYYVGAQVFEGKKFAEHARAHAPAPGHGPALGEAGLALESGTASGGIPPPMQFTAIMPEAPPSAEPERPAPAPEPPPDSPEIPEGFGGEDAVPEKAGDFGFGLPSIGMPEAPPAPEQPPPPEPEPPPAQEPARPASLPDSVFDDPGDWPAPSAADAPDVPALPPVLPPALPPIGPAAPPEAAQGVQLPPLNPRQQQMLEYLNAHGRITRKEYVELTGASVPTAARDLKELVDRGLIRGFGPLAKGRYYTLAQSG